MYAKRRDILPRNRSATGNLTSCFIFPEIHGAKRKSGANHSRIGDDWDWSFQFQGGVIRYTIKIDNDVWSELGEMSRDDGKI